MAVPRHGRGRGRDPATGPDPRAASWECTPPPSAFLHTRAGHVYLGHPAYLKRVLASTPHWTTLWAVDLTQLDPDRIVPDEDVVSAAWWGHGWEGFPVAEHWVSAPAPLQDVGWRPGPGGQGTRAYWANTTDGFDAPEVTAKSLAHGSVGYQGRIPPEALRRKQ